LTGGGADAPFLRGLAVGVLVREREKREVRERERSERGLRKKEGKEFE
jgi:hypothetical protein